MLYEIDKPTAESYFDGFKQQFQNKTSRLRLARSYLNGNPRKDVQFPSRLALGFRWGDSNDELQPFANRLYGLSNAATTFAGQHAIILSKGTPEMVFDEDTMLMHQLTFSVFKIGVEGLRYKPGVETNRQHVTMKIGVTAAETRSITTDIGITSVSESSTQVAVPFYGAVLSATSNLANYERSRKSIRELPVIMGNEDTAAFLAKLAFLNPSDELEQLAAEVALEAV